MKVLFSVGMAGTIWLIFFLMFVIIRIRNSELVIDTIVIVCDEKTICY
jgi:hypothetical protein